MSKKIDPKLKRELKAIADKVFELASNPHMTFDSEADRKKSFFSALAKSSADWRAPKQCMYRGCNKMSISRSHTVQKNGPLSNLAEGGHVLTPKMEPNGLVLAPIGLQSASTFAGFCNEHERLFEAFEADSEIKTDRDLALQMFRSVCREITIKRHDIDKMEDALSCFDQRLTKLSKKISADSGFEFRRVRVEGGIRDDADKMVASDRTDIVALQNIYDILFDFIDGKTTNIPLCVRAFNTNMHIPIALSGLGTLNEAYPVDSGSPTCSVLSGGNCAATRTLFDGRSSFACPIPEGLS